jgi:hypothetical protein
MDETCIDDTYQKDGETDDISLLSLTRSTLNLASLSIESLGSRYTDDNSNTVVDGLGISSVSSSSLCDSMRDELLRELRQELFEDM